MSSVRTTRLLRSATFRLALLYAVVFGASILLVLGFIYWSTAAYMARQADQTIEAEIESFAERYRVSGLAGLTALIQERLARAMPQEELRLVVANARRLGAAAAELGIPVVATEQYPDGLGRTLDEVREAVEGWSPLEKVAFDCCGADGFEIRCRDRLPVDRQPDDDPREALAQVFAVLGEAERRHDLAGGRDVETRLARHALEHASESDHDVPQRAVVHVDHAAPQHAPRIDAEPIAEVDVVVEQRRQQVVGRGDGVKVAGEVQIDPLPRHDLAAPSARRSANV